MVSDQELDESACTKDTATICHMWKLTDARLFAIHGDIVYNRRNYCVICIVASLVANCQHDNSTDRTVVGLYPHKFIQHTYIKSVPAAEF